MIPYEGIDLDYSLKGRTAIITGGASGIGYGTAKFFVDKGANVILADLSDKVNEVAKGFGACAVAVQGDVCEDGYPAKVIDAGVKAFGKIDTLINNAGVVYLGPAETLSAEYWHKTLAVNLSACFFMAQAVGKYMIDNKIAGSIVNISSQAGVIGLDEHVAYCVSKGGINSMNQVLAMEWGKYGIRVNTICPTVVLTDLGRKAWDNPAGDAFKKTLPAERFAEPDEIAACIGFLCSKGAAMITGHNLLVDGGYTAK